MVNDIEKINREALVRRHNPKSSRWDPLSPLSLGNGDFAFTADFTGLQSFVTDGADGVPRCTMSQQGFHSYPDAPEDSRYLHLKEYPHGGRRVGYMTDSTGQEELFDGLRINPHRFHLGQAGLFFQGISDGPEKGGPREKEVLARVEGIRQELDLWTGMLHSRFRFDGQAVSVETVCHPELPLISVRIQSALLSKGKAGLDLRFPYGSHTISGADWSRDSAHRSTLKSDGRCGYYIERNMDECRCGAQLQFFGDNSIRKDQKGPHHWRFSGSGESLQFSLLFAPEDDRRLKLPDFAESAGRASRYWKLFWCDGGAVSFEGSRDPRAFELERRVILSQYLLAIQSMGSLPPAETGLTCNSWYGKFHLEMHPWHALQGLLWGRSDRVEQSLNWYETILTGAAKRAERQGYKGVRWPKMTDLSGADSPSPIGCLLCWQQPHFILFAEMLYRLNPTENLMKKYAERVFLTAEFMADFPLYDAGKDRYVLGPPLIPAQENHTPEDTLNPLFELEYWRWGLGLAKEWKQRLKEPVPPKWLEVLQKLSPCPPDPVDSRRYAAHENCSDSYGIYGTDHPSMLLAYGFLPPQTAEPEKISCSIEKVLKSWNRESLWGWDFPSMAMTLARLGRRKDAVDVLLMESPKNRYMENGHNRQEGHGDLPLYLPGNGALLLAVAMMAAGWDGSSGDTPGFPDDGSWKVHWEGLARYI